MTVSLNKNIVEELVTFTLQHNQETIQQILSKWNQANIDDFIKQARIGELEDVEMDAITVRQLHNDVKKCQALLQQKSDSAVILDRKFAENLIKAMFEYIEKRINKIIKKWGYSAVNQMINDTRRGKLAEAEIDAIGLTNLLDTKTDLKKLWNKVHITKE